MMLRRTDATELIRWRFRVVWLSDVAGIKGNRWVFSLFNTDVVISILCEARNITTRAPCIPLVGWWDKEESPRQYKFVLAANAIISIVIVQAQRVCRACGYNVYYQSTHSAMDALSCSRVTRFSALHVTPEIENCVSSSGYNGGVFRGFYHCGFKLIGIRRSSKIVQLLIWHSKRNILHR